MKNKMSRFGATKFDGGGMSEGFDFKGLFISILVMIPIGIILGYLLN